MLKNAINLWSSCRLTTLEIRDINSLQCFHFKINRNGSGNFIWRMVDGDIVMRVSLCVQKPNPRILNGMPNDFECCTMTQLISIKWCGYINQLTLTLLTFINWSFYDPSTSIWNPSKAFSQIGNQILIAFEWFPCW